jgi:uncharacterized protein YecT (DUF1311 family)
MRRLFAASLILTTLAMTAARAQDVDPSVPTDADRQVIADCLANTSAEGKNQLACIGAVSDPCLADPENDNTPMMAACLDREAAIWDERLNDDYKALIDGVDKAKASKLRDSQRAWITVRDTTCDLETSFWEGGTGAGAAYTGCMLRETGARDISLASLRNYVDQ